MKNWLTYTAAAAAGLALVLFFPDLDSVRTILGAGAAIFTDFGRYLIIPFILAAFPAAIGALRRDRQAFPLFVLTFLWVGVCTFTLTTAAAFVAWIVFPAEFAGIVSTVPVDIPALPSLATILSGMVSPNVLSLLISPEVILPVILFALLLGIALKPDQDYMRPAFAVLNSFSEAFYRLAGIAAKLLIIGMVFLSGAWFAEVLGSGGLKESTKFLLLTAVITGGIILLVFPLLLVMIGKTKRPYLWIFGLTAPALLSAVTGNVRTAVPVLMLHTRSNLGAAKRISSTAVPLLSLFGRSGSAAIAATVVMTISITTAGTTPPFSGMIMIVLYSTLFSILSAFVPGLEFLFTIAAAAAAVGIGSGGFSVGAELSTIIPLLPLIGGAAALLDSYAAGLGAGVISRIMQAHSPVKGKDFI